MLHEVDETLRRVLCAGLPARTPVTFDAPAAPSSAHGETVTVFLHSVQEDVSARATGWIDDRDERGRVIERRLVPRRYRLGYLVTAYAADVPREHELLGAVLAVLAENEAVPQDCLTGSLAEVGGPVTLAVADPHASGTAAGMWQALGVPPRCSLELVVTAPLTPRALPEVAAPPSAIDLGIGQETPPAEPLDATAARPAATIRE